jgi:hypothetical protein
MIEVNRVIPLPDEDSGMDHSIVRVNNRNIDSEKMDTSRFFRRQPLIIKNKANNRRILRYVMGHKHLSIKLNEIAIDYDGIDALGISYKTQVDLVCRKARYHEVIIWFWNHPDLGLSLATRLGVLGLGLGVISLVLAL